MHAHVVVDAVAKQVARAPAAHPCVVTHAGSAAARRNGHEAATRAEIARRIARLCGADFGGEYDASTCRMPQPYFVPADTLSTSEAARMGIRGEADLYGGVVPHPHVATKTITHPLLEGARHVPAGWSHEFPRRVAYVALQGFTAFSRADAIVAAERLLAAAGEVRIKRAAGIAGLGQFVVASGAELARALDAIEPAELEREGAVIEENLGEVVTFGVGQVRIGTLTASYCGSQELTTDNRGREVYGGSRLTVARGGFDALLATQSSEQARLAIAQARVYDAAADGCFAGFFASRRNYDVAQGRDTLGRPRSGVLEQSWRPGGASGAEIAALEAFAANPALRCVRACTREAYGEPSALPPGAAVYFAGDDPHVGRLTKYAWIERHAHSG
jgi:hypothetical protein